jgi:zinc transporter ZupT
MVLPTLIAVILLSLIHLLAGKLRLLHVIPRSRWLSMAGGASVAYVFLHLLPELDRHQAVLNQFTDDSMLAHPAYLVALAGLVVFYGLEYMAKKAPQRSRARTGEARTGDAVFWIHIGSFAIYNFVIGYLLLQREESGLGNLALFTIAIGLHFLVNDQGLNDHHEEVYEQRGRWILTAAVFLGWGVSYLTGFGRTMVSFLLAFLAGGIILNVLKEELPEERQSRFSAFVLGTAAYTLLLLVV